MVALMASFPVYLVAELNNSKLPSLNDNPSLDITSPTENKNQPVRGNSKTKVIFLLHTEQTTQ